MHWHEHLTMTQEVSHICFSNSCLDIKAQRAGWSYQQAKFHTESETKECKQEVLSWLKRSQYFPPQQCHTCVPVHQHAHKSREQIDSVFRSKRKANSRAPVNPVFEPFQVKFMKSKPGAAMVEMGDCYAVDRAITHLNNNFLFGQKLNVWWVKLEQFNLQVSDWRNRSRTIWARTKQLLVTHNSFTRPSVNW